VDEAHHLEDNVTNQLSFEADQRSLERLLGELSQMVGLRRYTGFFNTVSLRCRGRCPRRPCPTLTTGWRPATSGRPDVARRRRVLQHPDGLSSKTTVPAAADQYNRRLRLVSAVRRQPAWDQVEIAWDNLSAGLAEVSPGVGRAGTIVGKPGQ